MTTETLNKDMTVKDVLERWPETLDVFVANGFENFRDAKQRNAVAAFLKLAEQPGHVAAREERELVR